MWCGRSFVWWRTNRRDKPNRTVRSIHSCSSIINLIIISLIPMHHTMNFSAGSMACIKIKLPGYIYFNTIINPIIIFIRPFVIIIQCILKRPYCILGIFIIIKIYHMIIARLCKSNVSISCYK